MRDKVRIERVAMRVIKCKMIWNDDKEEKHGRGERE